MNTGLQAIDHGTISKLVLGGDLKGLTDVQKVEYYNYRCQQAGLDPAAKPFDILVLNGKTVLYANAACTQQLTGIHKLSHQITGREVTEGIYCVFCRVTGPDERSTENMGAVPIEGLKGDLRSNAMMKATTKAIRRTVLAHMGLGMLDEEEVSTIPNDIELDVKPTLADLDEFESLMDRAYKAFKLAEVAEESPLGYNAFREKWKNNRAKDPAEYVLTKLSDQVNRMESAAQQKAKVSQ